MTQRVAIVCALEMPLNPGQTRRSFEPQMGVNLAQCRRGIPRQIDTAQQQHLLKSGGKTQTGEVDGKNPSDQQ